MDRVYSEHVRPRFGKRGLEEVREIGQKRTGAAFIGSLLHEDRMMRDCAKYVENMATMVRRIH